MRPGVYLALFTTRSYGSGLLSLTISTMWGPSGGFYVFTSLLEHVSGVLAAKGLLPWWQGRRTTARRLPSAAGRPGTHRVKPAAALC